MVSLITLGIVIMAVKRISKFIRDHLIALLLSLLILLLSFFLYNHLRESAKQKQQMIFDNQVLLIKSAIERRLKYYITTLKAGKGLFIVKDSVTRAEWKTFVNTLELQKDYPGVQGIGFAALISNEKLPELERAIRAEGFPDFNVRPEGERDNYSPIVYLEPFDWRNRRAFGYDMYSDSVRRKAMKRARDLNKSAMTGIVTLVQETKEDIQSGFLIYLPVYDSLVINTLEERRKSLIGYIYSAFRAKDLMHGILQNRFKRLNIRVYDGTEIKPENLLYKSDLDSYTTREDQKSKFQVKETITIAGQVWTIYIASKTKEFGYGRTEAYIVLISGTVISILIFTVLYFMGNARKNERKRKKEIERSARKLQRILEEIPAMVSLVKASNLTYFITNPLYSNFLHKKDLTGHSIDSGYIKTEGIDFKETLQKVIRTGEPFIKKEVPCIASGDREGIIYFNLVFQPINESPEKADYILIFAVEVTELVESRKAVAEKNDELSKKNIELTRINNDLDNFIYTASHDLKAPISNIEGLMNAMQREPDLTEGEKAELLNLMHLSIERFKSTILDLTEITKTQKNLEEVVEVINLPELTKQVINDNKSLIKAVDAQVITDFSEKDEIMFSRKNLRSIIYNLLSNALKYSSPDRKPEVRIWTEEKPDFTVLRISDNGLGISENNKEKIFYMFRRLHDHVEGTGVGLYIVKRIIDNAGGKIEVESEPGKGSTFKIFFRKNI